jgi:hypothetical protein
MPGALLVNCASSDIEFGAWRYVGAQCADVPACNTADAARYHCTLRLKTAKGHVFLLNSGFPIDFAGGPDPIPSASIQLTRALIFAGAIQAVNERKPGLLPLGGEVQHEIEKEFRRDRSVL